MVSAPAIITKRLEQYFTSNKKEVHFYQPFHRFIRDSLLYRHCLRVAVYSIFIAGRLGLSPQEQKAVFQAGCFHDLGKVKLPADLFKKEEPLTAAECRIVESHSSYSRLILCRLVRDRCVLDAVLHHHERYDGAGYPLRLAGENIPLGSRILAVADAFDIMIASGHRSKPLPVEAALAQVGQGAGSRFDPLVADALLSLYSVVH